MKKISLISLSFLTLGLISLPTQAQGLQEVLSQGEPKEESTSSRPARSQRNPSNSEIYSNLQTHSVGLGIGQTFLKSDHGRLGDDKITWDLFYGYRASHSFDFVANFHHMKHKFGETYTQTTGLALGLKARIFQFDNFSPYLLGGFGFYQPKHRRVVEGQQITSDSKTTFGWHIGSGAELQLNRHFSTGVLLHIHNPFKIEQADKADVEGWYYKLMLTGAYTF